MNGINFIICVYFVCVGNKCFETHTLYFINGVGGVGKKVFSEINVLTLLQKKFENIYIDTIS